MVLLRLLDDGFELVCQAVKSLVFRTAFPQEVVDYPDVLARPLIRWAAAARFAVVRGSGIVRRKRFEVYTELMYLEHVMFRCLVHLVEYLNRFCHDFLLLPYLYYIAILERLQEVIFQASEVPTDPLGFSVHLPGVPFGTGYQRPAVWHDQLPSPN
jgi:hypothetical protein